MFRTRKQSTTSYPLSVLMVDATTKAPATGKTVTATVSKSGAAFGACSGAMSEISSGIYALAGNATDRNTLGSSVYRFTATGCDDSFLQVEIVPYDVFDLIDAQTVKIGPVGSGTAQTARDIGASVLLSSGTGTGQVSLSSGAVLLQATQTGVTIPTVTTVTNAVTLPTIPSNWITASGIASDAITAAKVASDVGTEIATAVMEIQGDGDTFTAGSFGDHVFSSLPGVEPGELGGLVIRGTGDGQFTSTGGVVPASGNWSTHSAADVWAVTTRRLSDGTNIVLAKGTGITGFNDIAATAIVSGGAITTSGGAVSTVTNLTNLPTIPANWLTASGLASDAVAEIQSGLSTLNAAGIRTAVGLATANLDTQLAQIDLYASDARDAAENAQNQTADVPTRLDVAVSTRAEPGDAMTLAATPAIPASALGSPAAYYSADAGVTLTSGRVSAWADQSGNGHDATQGTAGNRPYFALDRNGVPELIFEFDGQHALNIPSSLTTNTAAFTIMAILSLPNPSGDGVTGGSFVDFGQIGTSGNFLGVYSAVSDGVFGRPYTYINNSLITYDRCILPLGRQAWSLSINGATQRGRMMRGPDMAYNGVASQGTNNVTGGRIGGAVGHSPFAGRFSAYVIWNRVLGEEEHRAYHDALARHWRCPLRRGRKAIVCIGDSITSGYNSTNAINWPSLLDRDKLDADIFCVARASEAANETVTRVTHTGHANTIATLWRGCEQVIALVNVGRNDIASGQTPATALTRVASVASALSSNFTHKIGVEQIHTQYVADADRVTFNAGLPAIFPQGVASVASTYFGALTTIAGENSLYAGESRSNDYIHPSAAGHAQIAAAVQYKLERLDEITDDRITAAAAAKIGTASLTAINDDATQQTLQTNAATLATRLTSARAGYLDSLNVASLATRLGTLPTSGTVYTGGDITGNLSGSVGSISGVTFPSGFSTLTVANIQSGLSTYAGGDTAGTTTLLSRLTSTRAGNLDNLDATITSRLATGSYTAPDNTLTLTSLGTSLDARNLTALNVAALLTDASDAAEQVARIRFTGSPGSESVEANAAATIDPQDVANAMLLAPVGTAADGSVVDLIGEGGGGATAEEAAAAVWTYGDRRLNRANVSATPATQFGQRTLYAGDDYSATARQFLVLLDGGEWPTDLSEAGRTWACSIAKAATNESSTAPATVTASVTVVTATGSGRALRVNVDGGNTTLCAGLYTYEVVSTRSGEEWTVESGSIVWQRPS